MEVFVRPKFYEDIAEEVQWLVERGGSELAGRWHDNLWNTIEFLRTHPLIGRERFDLKQPGIRSWRVSRFRRWLIFYGVRENALVLFRVRYAAMNLPALRIEN